VPKAFDRCAKSKEGRVRTVKRGSDKYQHVCYDRKGSHAGEVKRKKGR